MSAPAVASRRARIGALATVAVALADAARRRSAAEPLRPGLEEALMDVMADAGNRMRGAVPRFGAEPRAAFYGAFFDRANPEAVDWARLRSGTLITGMNRETLKAVRGVMGRAFSDGLPPRQSAVQLRSILGLSGRDSALMERRMKSWAEKGLNPARIEQRAAALRTKLINRRALLVARTETVAAANAGQLKLWGQAVERGDLPADVKRVWIPSPNACPKCLPRAGQTTTLKEPFPGGIMNPPLHPACRCSTGIATEEDLAAAQKGGMLPQLPPGQTAPASPSGLEPHNYGSTDELSRALAGSRHTVALTSYEAEALDNWNTLVGRKLDDVLDAYVGGPERRFGGTLWFNETRHGSPRLRLMGAIYDVKSGKVVGSLDRAVAVDAGGVKYAGHETLELRGAAQNSGLGKQILRSQMRFYERIGVERVDMFANIDVGGYAWARYGFLPVDESAWKALAKNCEGVLDGLVKSRVIDKRIAAEVRKILARRDPRAIWDLADINAPVTLPSGETHSIGKALLLGRGWSGGISLLDEAQMARFEAYIARKGAGS